MEMVDIENEYGAFNTFLSANGKSPDTLIMTLDELSIFRGKVGRWNRKFPAHRIVKMGFYTTLDTTTNKVTTYLVGLDATNNIIRPGGGFGDSPPHFK